MPFDMRVRKYVELVPIFSLQTSTVYKELIQRECGLL